MLKRTRFEVAGRVAGLVALLVMAPAVASAADAPSGGRFAWLDEFVPPLLTDFQVPGAAVVVVIGDEVAYQGGFGVCDAESGTRVGPRTSFSIASASKAFTAAAAASVVETGKVGWDTPVRQVLEGFLVADPMASERMTLRDLLAHRTGMARHDMVLTNRELSRSELVDGLHLLEAAGEFRDGFRYSDPMAAVAAEMLGRVVGSTWEQVVSEKLLAPLGMVHTTVGVPSGPGIELASPHVVFRGTLTRLDPLATDTMAPVTGLYSTAEDMASWLRFQLAGGRLGDRQVVAEAALLETHSPQIVIPTVGTPALPMVAYGMGWRVMVWKGRKMLMQGGGAAGYNSQVALLPFEGVGVAVLTNSSLNPIGELVATRALEVAVGMEPSQQVDRAKEVWAEVQEMRQAGLAQVRRFHDPSARPARPPVDYAGTFVHPLYGAVEVRKVEGGIGVRLQGFDMTVEHLRNDLFMISHPLFDDLRLEFRVDPEGGVESLTVLLDPAVKAIEFVRTP